MANRRSRGFTFVTFLILLGAAAAVFWVLVFGPLHWDNHEIKVLMREAGNSAYRGQSDGQIRDFILKRCDEMFGFDTTDDRGRTKRASKLEFEPEDLVFERREAPPGIKIRFRYSRTTTLPIVGGERSVEFYDEIDTDLTPHKY